MTRWPRAFPTRVRRSSNFLNEVEQINNSLWTVRQARETGSVAKFTKALWEMAPGGGGWQDTLDEAFERDFAGAEALKCALGANLLYFGDDPQTHVVDLLCAGAGREHRLGRRLHQRRFAAAQSQARQGRSPRRAASCGWAACKRDRD